MLPWASSLRLGGVYAAFIAMFWVSANPNDIGQHQHHVVGHKGGWGGWCDPSDLIIDAAVHVPEFCKNFALHNSTSAIIFLRFLEASEACASMDVLDLNGAHIGLQGANILAKALMRERPNCPFRLKDLWLDDNGLGDTGTMIIARSLVGKQMSLLALSLKGNGVGDDGATALAFLLNHSKIEVCFSTF